MLKHACARTYYGKVQRGHRQTPRCQSRNTGTNPTQQASGRVTTCNPAHLYSHTVGRQSGEIKSMHMRPMRAGGSAHATWNQQHVPVHGDCSTRAGDRRHVPRYNQRRNRLPSRHTSGIQQATRHQSTSTSLCAGVTDGRNSGTAVASIAVRRCTPQSRPHVKVPSAHNEHPRNPLTDTPRHTTVTGQQRLQQHVHRVLSAWLSRRTRTGHRRSGR